MNAKLYANRVTYDTVLRSGAIFHHRATAQGYFPENQMYQKFAQHIPANLAEGSAFTNHAMTRQIIVGYATISLTKNNCTIAGSRHHRSHSSRKFAHC